MAAGLAGADATELPPPDDFFLPCDLPDAATVLLLRDDAQIGLQVFMLRRHSDSAVLGGAYVFPGGKLDTADLEIDASEYLDQSTDALHQQLAEPEIDLDKASGLFVAAVREAFEECGVLFAQSLHQRPVDVADVWRQMREGFHLTDLLPVLQLQLKTQALVPWTRWITPFKPSVMNKRFDTRFFLAAAPQGQIAAHDNIEATESAWLSPRRALEDYWAGKIDLAPPQIMSLVNLHHYNDVAHAMQSARLRPPPTIQPEPFDDEGTRTICYPGDPKHSLTERVMHGPTRLRFVNRRFEPVDGFQGFLN